MSEAPETQSAADAEAAREALVRQRMLEIKDQAIRDLQGIRAELKRRQWKNNPALWLKERLDEDPWSKQVEIMNAIVGNRKVTVLSCHDVGKSFIAARIACWWIDIFPPGDAFVVTTAPTTAQVKSILWREIGRAHTKGRLEGRVNQTEWYLPVNGREEIVAFGRKPDEYDPAAFQGIHSQNVLVIIDEANGVRGPLHDAADSLIANDTGKMLMIGNPDDPAGEFYEASKPNSGWKVISIGAFDSPNFTGEHVTQRVSNALIGKIYVEERRKRWANTWSWNAEGTAVVPPPGVEPSDTHPFWQSKILGIFPQTPQGVHPLIPLPWITAAQQRELEVDDKTPIELGVDVGGGGDESVIAMNKGGLVRIVKTADHPNTMRIVEDVEEQLQLWRATKVKIDEIGIGRGVVDRSLEDDKKLPVIGINVGRASHEPARFQNLRAQFWWEIREMFERGTIDIDPEDEDLQDELVTLRYKPGDKGKVIMESKDEARRRGVASPNRADALMLSICDPNFVGEISSEEVSNFANANAELTGESKWSFAGATTLAQPRSFNPLRPE